MSLDYLYTKLKDCGEIIIYGAGYVGQIFYEWCMDQGVSVASFVISKQEKVSEIEGISVHTLTVSDNESETIIVVAVKEPLSFELNQKAIEAGYRNILSLDENTVEELEERKKAKALLRNQMMYPVRKVYTLENKKILVVAPHPDDEVIGCGGMLAHYGGNCDVLCINSSGVKYEWNDMCAEKIAEERVSEFYYVMSLIGIKHSWIAKIWGTPPMYDGINRNMEEYASKFDMASYDCIFVPHIMDGHREHRYVSTVVVPRLLKKSHVKKTQDILFYEVWSAIPDPNLYLDIGKVHEKKRKYIDGYKSRKKGEYAERILGLNKYRGIMNRMDYAEAYKIVSADEYLHMTEKMEGGLIDYKCCFKL